MGFSKFVEIGRVCTVNRGINEGKIVIILDIVNLNRVLVEGCNPTDNISRSVVPLRHLSLTANKVNILRGIKSSLLHKSIAKYNVIT